MTTADLPLSGWLDRLESLSPHEIDMGLERVARVLDRLDLEKPQTVIHVAGTNGKGSCVAMLEALLGTTGARIGCYTSPHVRAYNERIRIGGEDASDADIVAAFERVEAARGDELLTYFEYGTLAAMVVFAEAGVSLAILEVGMGGRLDAVNAVEPDAGLITNVSLDHCDWLGNDVEAIAQEKAGIMRGGKPVVFGARRLPDAIARYADETGARLVAAGRDYDWSAGDGSWSWAGRRLRLDGLAMPGLPGAHQLANVAAVLALCEAAGFDDVVNREIVDAALAGIGLDGRMQRIGSDPGWLLDVAHNPAAAEALAAMLSADPAAGLTVAIVGLLDDKDVRGVIAPLAGIVDEWIAVTADSPRAIPGAELARQIANLSNRACLDAGTLQDAIDRASSIAEQNDRILITGSFYVVGPALERIEGMAERGHGNF